MVIDRRFWKEKRVFLTGHTGFKGGWLALWLQSLGARVTGYALAPPSRPNLFDLAKVRQKIQSLQGDVRNFSALKSTLHRFQPDIVFHLAAQAYVSEGYTDPIGTYSTNVMGTVNLLDACRSAVSVRAIVNVTTDKCYENFERGRNYVEMDRLGGIDPYASSKACSELVTRAFRKSFFELQGHRQIGVATARAGNVIGGGDWSLNRVIPDCVRAWVKKKPVVLRRPDAVRPWQHVLNPLSGYLVLAQKLFLNPHSFSDAWNFGPSRADCRPVGKVVKQFSKAWGGPANLKINRTTTFKESTLLHLSSAKAAKSLRWKPVWNLEKGLAKTAEWYHRFAAKDKNLNRVCLDQIADFMSDASQI